MWPMYVDYTDDECKKVLRSLELEAYASVINAFRAQGSLSKERKKMLQDLCSILSISLERHRAEIRRAVNDEHLNTIAERLSGPNTSTEWAIEGRRLVPLMPRLVPQTVFTAIANSVATAQAAKNATLPMPGKTGMRENGENDIIETMVSRKRKEPPTDISATSKYVAIENLLANSFDSANDLHTDAMQTLNESSISDCSTTSVSSTSQIAPILSETSPVTTMSFITTCTSPIKTPVKHATGKPASTVTTFSSFDQLSSNISSSKTISPVCVPAVGHEEQVSTSDSNSKFLSDIQDITRLSQSSCTSKPLATSGTTPNSSLPVERFPMATSSASSRSKFLPQVVKPKTSPHIKPSIPTSLGLKINAQPPVGQRAVSPKSTNLRAKPETNPTLMRKPIPTVNPPQSPSSESASVASTSLLSNESLPMLKSPLPVTTKSIVTKSECLSTSNQSILQQPTTKVTTLPKPFQKPGTPNSQFVARTLFSSGAKTGAKSLPPVIFNVSTSPCSSVQSSSKTTVPGQSSEAAKAQTPQLLPKAPTGLAPNQFKLSTSNAPTIQYRNEGGMVRSARIVNITQPVGSRLPCAISPSAISALGLSSGITSTALRVTLPAGTLNTSSALRVSAAAKPNVIVVHKAQMWPRTQGAAVIMSSTGSIPKLSNDVKLDKSRQCINKVIPRPIAPATSQLPASSNASVKVSEVNSLAALSTKGLPSENTVQPDSTSTKASESAEAKCKRNLLADVIEASGIMMAGTPENFLKKDFENKDSHRLKPVSEIKNNKNTEEVITIPSEPVTSTATAQGTSLDKLEIIRAESPSVSLTSQNSERQKKAPDTDQGSLTHLDAIQVQAKKPCDIFTSRTTQETVHKSSPSCEAKPKITTEAK